MSILTAIGNTPLIELSHVSENPNVRIFAKLEGSNPGGSIKDRAALFMVLKAEEEGLLHKGKTILEATSGNTGIALAMIGAAKGYEVTLTMPSCVSVERQNILKALGANIILTDGCHGTDGAINKAHELLHQNPDKYFMPNQFDNTYNFQAHYNTTGPEIWKQRNGNLDYFIAGMGTTGTIMGTGKYLKEKNPNIKIIGVEPPIGHRIQGLKNMKEAIVPKIFSADQLDEIITVEDDEAFEMARFLALYEGVFVGMSSGAATAGAYRIAQRIDHGIIVVILPDRGDRYLSTSLFKSICAKCPP
jgi:S-sulfo-L-cysteine synthase (O-acetyl-L-serine-dependent)